MKQNKKRPVIPCVSPDVFCCVLFRDLTRICRGSAMCGMASLIEDFDQSSVSGPDGDADTAEHRAQIGAVGNLRKAKIAALGL